jgi:outer membrane biosynthesis protein TonB
MRKTFFSFLIKCVWLSSLTTCIVAQSSSSDKKSEKPKQTDVAEAKKTDSKADEQCDFSSDDTLKVIPKDLYLLLKKQPVYPKAARRKKVSGDVLVRVLLNREGLAERTCIVKGHKLLVPPVLAVIRKWRYPKDSIQKDLSFGNYKYLEFVVTYTFK